MKNTAQMAGRLVRRRIRGKHPRRRVSSAVNWALDAQPDAPPASTHDAMLRWLDLAVRYHSARYLDQIVAFRTVAGPGGVDGLPALYVWELTRSREPSGIGWVFTVWDVSGHGVRFLDCASEEEALRLYSLPLAEGLAAVVHAPGVRLRPDVSTVQGA